MLTRIVIHVEHCKCHILLLLNWAGRNLLDSCKLDCYLCIFTWVIVCCGHCYKWTIVKNRKARKIIGIDIACNPVKYLLRGLRIHIIQEQLGRTYNVQPAITCRIYIWRTAIHAWEILKRSSQCLGVHINRCNLHVILVIIVHNNDLPAACHKHSIDPVIKIHLKLLFSFAVKDIHWIIKGNIDITLCIAGWVLNIEAASAFLHLLLKIRKWYCWLYVKIRIKYSYVIGCFRFIHSAVYLLLRRLCIMVTYSHVAILIDSYCLERNLFAVILLIPIHDQLPARLCSRSDIQCDELLWKCISLTVIYLAHNTKPAITCQYISDILYIRWYLRKRRCIHISRRGLPSRCFLAACHAKAHHCRHEHNRRFLKSLHLFHNQPLFHAAFL